MVNITGQNAEGPWGSDVICYFVNIYQAWIQDSVVQNQDQDSDAQDQGQIKHDTAIA